MPLPTEMKTEMQRGYFISVFIFELELPIKTVRLLDAAAEIHWKGHIWRGSDDVFGSIGAVDPLQEQVGTEAPVMRIKMLATDNFSLSYLTDPNNQGAPFNIYWGVVDEASGILVSEPYLLFGGELDSSEADYGESEVSVTMEIASVWERLFMDGEGMRLNNAQHQRTWSERASEERGFEFVVAIQRNEPWGYGGPRPPLVSDVIGGQPVTVGGGSAGGGGGSIGGGGSANWNRGSMGVISGRV